MSALQDDPRWQRFNDADFTCACCGQSFGGVMDIAMDHPDCWPHGNRSKSGKDILKVGEDSLSTDLCSWEEHRFIRGILPFQITGCDERFAFGVWGSVHPDQFELYAKDEVDTGGTGFEGCFTWLMNDLPGFETPEPVACDLKPMGPGRRPEFHAHEGPVHEAQQSGISFDRLLDIYAASGNDIRPHLT